LRANRPAADRSCAWLGSRRACPLVPAGDLRTCRRTWRRATAGPIEAETRCADAGCAAAQRHATRQAPEQSARTYTPRLRPQTAGFPGPGPL